MEDEQRSPGNLSHLNTCFYTSHYSQQALCICHIAKWNKKNGILAYPHIYTCVLKTFWHMGILATKGHIEYYKLHSFQNYWVGQKCADIYHLSIHSFFVQLMPQLHTHYNQFRNANQPIIHVCGRKPEHSSQAGQKRESNQPHKC